MAKIYGVSWVAIAWTLCCSCCFVVGQVSPGGLVCASVGLVNAPAAALGTCGAYHNNNATESPIMTPNELCQYFCNGNTGAYCKNNLYCYCPNTPVTQTPPTWCFPATNFLLAPRAPSSAAVTTCERFCGLELKTEYFCESPIPRQINQQFCVCAPPSTPLNLLPDLSLPVPPFYTCILNLLNNLLLQLPLPSLPTSLLQSVITFLTPLSNIVCNSVGLLDGPAGSVTTCYTFNEETTNITCQVAASENPMCFCQAFCPNSQAVCTSVGSCVCDHPPSRQYCGPAGQGTQSTICRGLCGAGQVAYNCDNEYCVCAPS